MDSHRSHNPASGQIHLHKKKSNSLKTVTRYPFPFSFLQSKYIKSFSITFNAQPSWLEKRRMSPPSLPPPHSAMATPKNRGDMGGATLWGPGGRSCVKKAHQLHAKNSDETVRVIKQEGGKKIAPCSSWHVSE